MIQKQKNHKKLAKRGEKDHQTMADEKIKSAMDFYYSFALTDKKSFEPLKDKADRIKKIIKKKYLQDLLKTNVIIKLKENRSQPELDSAKSLRAK